MLNNLGNGQVKIQSKPIEIATEAEMDAILLNDSNVDKVYLFTGATTSKYVNGDMYVTEREALPAKGDLITISDAPIGAQLYRVLNITGNIAEVLGMDEINTSCCFNTINWGHTYEGGELDTFLNTAWYNTLSTKMKNAIVAKTFTQDSWYRDSTGSPNYNCSYKGGGAVYQRSLEKAAYKTAITRNVYAIGLQDIIDYLGAQPDETVITLNDTNLWKMYYNTSSAPSSSYIHWLRSAVATFNNYPYSMAGSTGYIHQMISTGTPSAVRASFQIDVSKVNWSFAE